MQRREIEMCVTCGIEIETDALTKEHLPHFQKRNTTWRYQHDASCETDKNRIDLGLVVGKSEIPLAKKNNIVVGAELVSDIFNSDDENFFYDISAVCRKLEELGEPRESERSGIHYHISLPDSGLRILKSLLRLGRYFEPLFFYAGGMGYKFRGESNDSIYCRPITGDGPPYVPIMDGNTFSPCFNIPDLLKAKTTREFWTKFGDIRHHDFRYNPIRYMWLNLYPLYPGESYKGGTVEFRVFNKTLNPFFIYATFFLCRKFVELALTAGFRDLKELNLLKENSIYDSSKSSALDLLDVFTNITGLDKKFHDIISCMIKTTPTISLREGLILSHLLHRIRRYYWNEDMYRDEVKKVTKSNCRKPEYTDIHVLRGEI